MIHINCSNCTYLYLIKPLLDKAKHVNTNKFMDVVGSLVGNQSKGGLTKSLIPATSIFSTLTSLVGNLTINEKRITRNDLDSFILNIGRYFGQYEKLHRINQQFDISIDKTDLRLQEHTEQPMSAATLQSVLR